LREEAIAFAVEAKGPAVPGTYSAMTGNTSGHDGVSVAVASDGTATWSIPLSVSVRLGGLAAAARGDQPSDGPAPPSLAGDGRGSEVKLVLDPRYTDRTG
jgi:hypothetical protein